MSLFNVDLEKVYTKEKEKVVKVITQLSNFNMSDVSRKIKAAELGGATYVDIAAHPDIVLESKLWTSLPICVSSIDPIALYKCVLVGADMVEIGNFDTFYDRNIYFSEKQVINLAKEVKFLLNNIKVCITIPHKFLLDQQIQLAVKLKKIAIEVIQTEGRSTKNRLLSKCNSRVLNSTCRASSTLSSSYIISKYINVPVIASSGIDILSAPIAISYGVSGVGLCSSLNKLQDIKSMAIYVNEIVISLSKSNSNESCIVDLKYTDYLVMHKVQCSFANDKIV